MRGRSAMLAALAILGVLLVAAPASAAPPPPLASISVTPGIERPSNQFRPFNTDIVVSWTGEDASASGVRLCLVQGVKPSADPNSCSGGLEDVPAPAQHSDPLGITAGKAYSISAFAYTDGSTTEYSSPQTVTWNGSALKGDKTYHLTYGVATTLRATLSDTTNQTPISGQSVRLMQLRSDSWHLVTTDNTNAAGTAKLNFSPEAGGAYAVEYGGAAGHLAAVLPVSLRVAYRVTAHLSDRFVSPGQRVKVYGIVRPSTHGEKVTLAERVSATCPGYINGPKVAPKQQTLPNGHRAYGYVFTISRTSVGQHRLHVYTGNQGPLDAGYSPDVTLTVGGGTRASTAMVPTC